MPSLPSSPGAPPAVTLILGGARCGKSSFAQQRAQQRAQQGAQQAAGQVPGNVLFLATAQPFDQEMRHKITRHQADRPAHWTLVEEPLDLAGALTTHAPGHALSLVDCLTLYASNLLLRHENDPNAIESSVAELLEVLASPPLPILLVSNEVGSGIVPEYPLGRRYRDLLGELNRRVAALATEVLLLVAGLPLTLKREGF